ncbi:MAG: ABC transporter permease subunit, partial [Candidatus Omnitrophica bacterium]|nr:ABC transporter permease subunit [Candidatus Omnitrophota bacterium]
FKILDETLGSLMVGLQVLPSICWLPLAILWFGLNEQAIQFVIIMGAFLSIAIATDSGIRNIPPIYIRAAKTMGVKGLVLYARVILPAALPSIATGMKLGWSFAWRSLMAGELIFVSVGLGHLLQIGRELNDMPQVMAVMLLIVFVGLLFDQLLFARFEKKLRRLWGVAT